MVTLDEVGWRVYYKAFSAHCDTFAILKLF